MNPTNERKDNTMTLKPINTNTLSPEQIEQVKEIEKMHYKRIISSGFNPAGWVGISLENSAVAQARDAAQDAAARLRYFNLIMRDNATRKAKA